MKTLLIHTWTAYKNGEDYYLPYMHWIYLSEIREHFSKIYILVPVGIVEDPEDLVPMNYHNVQILPVPFYSSYLGAIKTFFHYLKQYYNLPNVDVVYSRYPAPFGWLQKVFCKKKKRIIHYVGDPLDAAKNNPNFSKLKKIVFTTLFMPEYFLFIWACKGATVFTNGFDISERLKKKNILATPLISSTLVDNDFCLTDKIIDNTRPKIIYIGYLRTAKGVETVIKAFAKFLNDYPEAVLTIVGEGEFEYDLKQLVSSLGIQSDVRFHPFIDDRGKINSLLRDHDLFCFGSLSEGSPRVILEAMANGLNVLSTPVGSLPYIFNDYDSIVYADFNDVSDFHLKMKRLFENTELMLKIRNIAYFKVKNFTIKQFINSIFEEVSHD